MAFTKEQHPVGVQIFGENLNHLAYAAQEVEQMGADFVDLNFGCPVSKVVKRGGGSAALKDLKFFTQILKTVKKAVSFPVTIKVRTGWDEAHRNSHEVSHIAFNEGIQWMSLHGRTRSQAYNGLSDWDYIKSVAQQSPIAVIGNGDLTCARQAYRALKNSGCTAVMIGRGALKNPLIFLQALSLFHKKPFQDDHRFKISYLLDRLCFHLENHYDTKKVTLQMKKFSVWYSSGYPGSSHFRKNIFPIQGLEDTKAYIKNFFSPLKRQDQKDTSHEAFLKGGHG